MRSMPRLPPFMFVLVLPFDLLGWALRKAGTLAPDSKILAPLGWSARPGFRWELPKYPGNFSGKETGEHKPDDEAIKHACAALEAAREVVRGKKDDDEAPAPVLDGPVRSAIAAVKRANRRRDGVATRQVVDQIVVARVGRLEAQINAKVDALRSEMTQKMEEMK